MFQWKLQIKFFFGQAFDTWSIDAFKKLSTFLTLIHQPVAGQVPVFARLQATSSIVNVSHKTRTASTVSSSLRTEQGFVAAMSEEMEGTVTTEEQQVNCKNPAT